MTDTLTLTHQAAELAESYKQWSIGSNQAGQVLPKARFEDAPDRSYTVKNRGPRKFLQYEKQNWGINLGWTDDASPETAKRVARWFFTTRDNKGPVTYGETIALANGTGDSFLKHAHRDRGIDLDWSGAPVYEWQLLGGKTGQPVTRAQYLAIYNTKAKIFFVHFDRNLGGDIGYSDSERWEAQLSDALKKALIKFGKEAVKEAVMAALAA